MSNLYELTGQYLQLQALLEAGDEEYPVDLLTIGDELQEYLEGLINEGE